MSTPDYERVGTVIAQILARIVLSQPDDEEEPHADDRRRPGVDQRPG